MYKHGDGVTEDQSKAAELFRKACDGGSRSECHNLGWMYKKGEGVTADQSKAAELFRKACDGGYSWSCQQL